MSASHRVTSVASSVSEFTGNINTPILRNLIEDAAAIRFFQNGKLESAELTVVGSNGDISKAKVTDLEKLPDNLLVGIVENYLLDVHYYESQAQKLKEQLGGGAPLSGRRRQVLSEADNLFNLSKSSFISGDISESRAWLDMALGVLDIASLFVPGVDWGRDIYEAVTGKDLFTGRTLDNFDRVSAVVGVLSLGVGNNISQIRKALNKISDLPANKLDELYEFSQVVDGDTLAELTISGHAKARMLERGIDEVNIKRALDNHNTHFWSRRHDSYLAIDNNINADGLRNAVAINPWTKTVTTVMNDLPPTDDLVRKQRYGTNRAQFGDLAGRHRYEEIKLD